MTTRRLALVGLLSAGALDGAGVPANACDCHTHVFGDPKRYPMSAGRSYTPQTASPAEMGALHRRLKVDRVVIVTASVYGTDNSATLYGMKARGGSARGIAVIGDETTSRELEAMQKAGVRGIRLNLATSGATDAATTRKLFEAAAARVAPLGWHVQLYVRPSILPGIKDAIAASKVPVSIDHVGDTAAMLGVAQAGFADLVDLVRAGHAYVKITHRFAATATPPGYTEAAPLANALIAANPDRILWGTDWPHTDSGPRAGRNPLDAAPFLKYDDGKMFQRFIGWVPDAGILHKILVDNPARLYGF